MNEGQQKIINSRLEELAQELKLDLNDEDWEERLRKDLKNTKIYGKIYIVLIGVILIISIVILTIGLIFKGEELFGIFMKEKYFDTAMLITCILILGLNYGPLIMRREKIKAFLFLYQVRDL